MKVILFAKYFLVCTYNNSSKKWQFFIHMRKILLSKICSYKTIFFFSKNIMHINFSFKMFKKLFTHNLYLNEIINPLKMCSVLHLVSQKISFPDCLGLSNV